MAGYVYAPYNAYQGYGTSYSQNPPAPQPPVKNKPAAWKQGKVSDPVDYLDNYQRAQLKAILAQVNPSLTPRLRKANTKEVGVQVNPRVDAGVQCSLGPRTLRRPQPVADLVKQPVDPERFSRPVAVYSPVVDKKLFCLPQGGHLPKAGQAVPEQPLLVEEEPAPEHKDKKEEEPTEGTNELKETKEALKRSAFQFLEQKYGYFHCKDCKTRWESAYVWCISGSNKVYFKQLCRKCQKGFNPYRVEQIQCQVCSKTRCSCPQKKRHIDLKRPHRQELCGRCKNKRLACDNTYSFKYLV
ncbi:ZAR1-like protein [Bombina bombina]|uniref:ZAR1-like protein n=1 Tax=Bombina bombina TaxID=8345 RepID=UPI00235A5088|nr:ZAR1-like protein [Bombina bombina]